MHGKGISHRDMKTENVLYDKDKGLIKIIDLGISKQCFSNREKITMYSVTGTLKYKAPEMIAGGGYDQKVDCWAIGVMLYELVTGKTPFESEYH